MPFRSSVAWRRFGNGAHDAFDRPVRVAPVLRIALALIVMAGGVLLAVVGFGMTVAPPPRTAPHPVAASLMSFLLGAMGVAFVFVGSRVLFPRPNGAFLLGRRARLIFAAFIAIAALGELVQALVRSEAPSAVEALVTGAWSAALFYATLSKRQAARRAILHPSADPRAGTRP